jgi:hypothetical protein
MTDHNRPDEAPPPTRDPERAEAKLRKAAEEQAITTQLQDRERQG